MMNRTTLQISEYQGLLTNDTPFHEESQVLKDV